MRHAAHKAGSARSARRMDSSSFSDYLAGARGRRGAAAVEAAGSGSAMAFTPVVDAALADKLNEVAPQTRRAMRQAAKACARKNHIMAGSALAVLFGAAAGAVAFANPFSGVDGGRLAVADARQSAVQVTNGSTADAASRSQSVPPWTATGLRCPRRMSMAISLRIRPTCWMIHWSMGLPTPPMDHGRWGIPTPNSMSARCPNPWPTIHRSPR